MSRLVKHIGGRSCPEDDTKVLMAIPFGPGEKIKSINMHCYFASGDSSAIDQPGELNWYGITIPWSLVLTTPMIIGGTPDVLTDVVNIDKLYAQWLKDVGDDGGEVFGGDANSDIETVEGEASHADEELIDSGPIGVNKFFSREVLMTPLAAEGNTEIRFGDSFSARPTNSIKCSNMGGLALFGMVRFQADVETNFNIELDDGTSKEGMGLLMSGDYTKIKAKIEGDTGVIGDYLRTILFGGDNFIENNTLKTQAGKAYVKASIFIESAISRLR